MQRGPASILAGNLLYFLEHSERPSVRTQKIAVIFGTRPDTIKLAPIILQLRRERRFFHVVTIATAQHRQMLDQVLDVFRIRPDHDLNVMRPNQTLAEITKNTIGALDHLLARIKPGMVLVQGDTTTTFVGSLAAFYRRIPVGHVEAGLRTHDKSNPYPEEINRRLTSSIADLHFAPTDTARKALLRENIRKDDIFVTGNSVIDALKIAVRKQYTFSVPELNMVVARRRKIVLITMHRRENWGPPMESSARAIRRIAEKYPEIDIVFPVHLNPVVREVVFRVLSGLTNVSLIHPLDYLDFVNMIARSYLIITDSGGVQEEAPSLGKPVLVLRDVTERPEAVEYGTVRLVGLREERIVSAARKLLDDRRAYDAMASATNPYGDGLAARRTVRIIKHYFGYSRTLPKEFVPR
jgi:UDP-N-acetylglucosamine 2-epimerase (non-hydrolysing)